MPSLTPLLAVLWGIVLVALFIGLVLWEWSCLRGAREDLDHAFRDRSER